MKETVFRERDVRGRYPDEINEDLFNKIGNAMAQSTERDIIVACDARIEGPALMNAFMNGALKAEKTVMNIGMVPQASAINWAITQQMELAYVTGSHLPKGLNGVKFFHYDGMIYNKEEVSHIASLVKDGKYFSRLMATPVREEAHDISNIYIRNVTQKVKSTAKKKIRILIDCGNGVNGMIAKEIFSKAGFNADVMFEKPDGNFPNRNPDPKTDPLEELRKKVKKYDVGIAYDADGDRFFAVSKEGDILTTEQTAYVILTALQGDGDIIANVECGRSMDFVAKKFNRNVIRVPVGVLHMEHGVRENNAILGVESSQHWFVPSIMGFSDAIATSMVFCKGVEDSEKSVKEIVKDVPTYKTIRKIFECPDERRSDVMSNLKENISSKYSDIDTMDGVRVELPNGWILLRPAHTESILRLTIEADDEAVAIKLDEEFSDLIQKELA